MPIYVLVPLDRCINGTNSNMYACYKMEGIFCAINTNVQSYRYLNIYGTTLYNRDELSLSAQLELYLPSNMPRKAISFILQSGIYTFADECKSTNEWSEQIYQSYNTTFFPSIYSSDQYNTKLEPIVTEDTSLLCPITESQRVFHSSSLYYRVSIDATRTNQQYSWSFPLDLQRTVEAHPLLGSLGYDKKYYHLAFNRDGMTTMQQQTATTNNAAAAVTFEFVHRGTRTFYSNTIPTFLQIFVQVIITFVGWSYVYHSLHGIMSQIVVDLIVRHQEKSDAFSQVHHQPPSALVAAADTEMDDVK